MTNDKIVSCALDGEVRLHVLNASYSNTSMTLAEHDDTANRLAVIDANTLLSVGGDGQILHVCYSISSDI